MSNFRCLSLYKFEQFKLIKISMDSHCTLLVWLFKYIKSHKEFPNELLVAGRPGLVVMGGVSRSRGHGFESQHGYWMEIFTLYCKNCNVFWKYQK